MAATDRHLTGTVEGAGSQWHWALLVRVEKDRVPDPEGKVVTNQQLAQTRSRNNAAGSTIAFTISWAPGATPIRHGGTSVARRVSQRIRHGSRTRRRCAASTGRYMSDLPANPSLQRTTSGRSPGCGR